MIAACNRCGRNPDTVRLVAVSKTVGADTIRQVIEAGAAILGESYIQEAREKHEILAGHPVSWHFIGHLQANKAKYAVKLFDLIHSVDSLRLAVELDHEARKIQKIQNVLIQINIGHEISKSGIELESAESLIRDISKLSGVSVNGLMVIPPFFADPGKVRPFFKKLRILRDSLQMKNISEIALNELSMGMTGDFETAIEEGATLVRIGTAIFGERN